MHFAKVLDAGSEFGTGRDIERGGLHAQCGPRGILRHDATGKNDRDAGVLVAELNGHIPIEDLAGAAIDTRRLGIEENGRGAVVSGVGKPGARFDADGECSGAVPDCAGRAHRRMPAH